MNSITLVGDLIEKKTSIELNQYLSSVWNMVWSDRSVNNYAKLRLFKIVDKIQKIRTLGVDFTNKKVADLGCGDGTGLVYLQKYFNIHGVGVDISDDIVHDLNSHVKNPSLSFVVGDHRNLIGLQNNVFDIVLSFGVIEHFKEYGLALSEARRILRPQGKLVLIQPNLLSFGVVQEYLLRARNKWKFGKQKDLLPSYYVNLLVQLGYGNIKYTAFPPYQDMKVSRLFDSIINKAFPSWGHYLYIIAEKE